MFLGRDQKKKQPVTAKKTGRHYIAIAPRKEKQHSNDRRKNVGQTQTKEITENKKLIRFFCVSRNPLCPNPFIYLPIEADG